MAEMKIEVLERLPFHPKIKEYLKKDNYEKFALTNILGEPLNPWSSQERVGQSLDTRSAAFLKKVQDAEHRIGIVGAFVAGYGARANPHTIVGVAAATGLYHVAMDVVKSWADESAEMNKLLTDSHVNAYDTCYGEQLGELGKTSKELDLKIQHLLGWMQAIDSEKTKENMYKVHERESSRGSEISMSDIVPQPPDYEILDSADGVSMKDMEKALIMLVGALYGVSCRINAELVKKGERVFKPQPNGYYAGRITEIDESKGIALQEITCGPNHDRPWVEHRIKDIGPVKRGETYAIYYDSKKYASVRQIELSPENYNDHHY